jgi:hypothetical protein
MSLQKMLGNVTDNDVREIERISRKGSIQKLSNTLLKDLNRDILSRMISSYMVLKANGHPDSDFAKYLTTKETKKVLKLGFGAAGTLLPSLLTDGEFRSLVMNTRKQMKRQKQESEQKQRRPQEKLADEPKNVAKIGPLTVKARPHGFSIQSENYKDEEEAR